MRDEMVDFPKFGHIYKTKKCYNSTQVGDD